MSDPGVTEATRAFITALTCLQGKTIRADSARTADTEGTDR